MTDDEAKRMVDRCWRDALNVRWWHVHRWSWLHLVLAGYGVLIATLIWSIL